MAQFTNYTDILLDSFKFNNRPQDVINKKVEILSTVEQHYNKKPDSVLFVGFNPWILGSTYNQTTVTKISDNALDLLNHYNVEFNYIPYESITGKYDWVVASDEYFTFAESEEQQKNNVEKLISLSKNQVITTLRDYKNQDFKDREFSNPLSIRKQNDIKIFLEFNDYEYNERNVWKTSIFEINNTILNYYGPFNRTSMYFKQLAKFSKDAGAHNFLIHKNLMYKSLIKKNYEHVISIPVK